VYLVTWWLAEFGGMERHLTELARALHRRSVDVRVFTEMPVPRRNIYRRGLRENGVAFWSPPIPSSLPDLQRRKGHPVDSAPLAHSSKGALAIWLQRRMEREAASARPDVVHVHGFRLGQPWVVSWAVGQRIPVVYTEHSTLGDWNGPQFADSGTILQTADAVATVSGASRVSLGETLPGREIFVHPHIVRPPGRLARHDRLPVEIVSAGRVRFEKGMDVLVSAAARLRGRGLPFRLTVLGDGPDRNGLVARVAAEGLLEVIFAGSQTPDQVRRMLGQASIFVLASRKEGLPVAILEAMARGLAIVATRVGGIPELIQPEVSGLLVDVDDEIALTDTLERLIQDQTLRLRLGAGAHAAFESSAHMEDTAVTSVLDTYRSVLRPALQNGPTGSRL
jgi:glycosyltransferase involved in cell wall biosynthesis